MSGHILRVRQLYKLIFRLHRGLPVELRVLGDNYARDEFKRHKKCEPHEAHIFMKEWAVSQDLLTYSSDTYQNEPTLVSRYLRRSVTCPITILKRVQWINKLWKADAGFSCNSWDEQLGEMLGR